MLHPCLVHRLILLPIVALTLLTTSTTKSHAGDFQAWQWLTVDLHHDEHFRFYVYADNRIGKNVADIADSYLQIVSPRVTWHAQKHLDLGLGYAWLNVDPLTEAGAFWQHRAEFEFNPKFSTGPWSFHNRNRLELRWNEGRGKRRPRLRTRLQAKYKLGDGFFKHVYVNNEFFFDLTNGNFSENRLIPAALGLKLTDYATLNLFYMLQSLDRPTGWKNNQVAGTFLQLAF
jgi:hypothetical protein